VAQSHEAMHIARVVRKYKDREYVSWLLRRSFREDRKMRHKALANLSVLSPAGIEALQAVLAGKTLVDRRGGLEGRTVPCHRAT